MKTWLAVSALLISWPARAATFCNFPTPPDASINLVQAFAAVSKYYGQASDVSMLFYGCRNAEVAVQDTTYGLLAKNGLPEERVDGVKYLFIFFTAYRDGAYRFVLDETDDPWMDGYATVDATTGVLAPQYDFGLRQR